MAERDVHPSNYSDSSKDESEDEGEEGRVDEVAPVESGRVRVLFLFVMGD